MSGEGRTFITSRGGSGNGGCGRKKRGINGHGESTEPVQGALGATAGETAEDGGQREPSRRGAVATQIGLVDGGGGQRGIYEK